MLSGKDVYDAARPLLAAQGLTMPAWDHAPQVFYDGIADWLNASHMLPVHKRVNDLMDLLAESQKDRDTAMSLIIAYRRLMQLMPAVSGWSAERANVANWQRYRGELDKRAQTLLFGEEKVQL
jgi:hypothetical protein